MQRSFDDLGVPLSAVTFAVIDIEATGGAAADGGITEVGAVKVCGGECLGTFQTFVNPGQAIPPNITVLTGITQSMVLPAPRIETVLPSLLEFVRDAVIVGHNVRYDLGFLNAALDRAGRPRFSNRSVDTCALARRLLRDDVPNCRLGTLASRLRLPIGRRTARWQMRWPPPTCCTCCSSAPRGSACWGSTTCSRCRPSPAIRRSPSSA